MCRLNSTQLIKRINKNFPLVTLDVADEISKGFPVGFLISSHADKRSLRLCLEGKKKRYLEDLKMNTVMVDDDSNTWNKFRNVFGSVEYDLLCK